ncbi:MAG: F0F1 ATP synthase subunit B [Planctomycetota bacterium]|nr:F0F1 ATP synthase subunit B [Planctomycetota bacterium]
MRILPTILCCLALLCSALSGSRLEAAAAVDAEQSAHPEHGDHAEGHTHIGAPTGDDASNIAEIRSDLAFFSFIVFLILLAILYKFAWGPIAAALERREHNIAENIAAAQRAGDDARAMLAQYEKKLSLAAEEVRGILEEARRDAEGTKQEIIAEAKAAAQLEHDRLIRDVNTAKSQALKEISETSVNLAVDLAGKLVKAKLSAEEHAGLVNDALTRFAAEPSRN